MAKLREKPLATPKEQQQVLQVLQTAKADEMHVTYLPNGSMIVRLTPHQTPLPEGIASQLTAEEQRTRLSHLPKDETEDSEEWISNIQAARVDKEHVPFADR